MAKRIACFTLMLFGMFCFILDQRLYAQGGGEDLKAKMRDLREKKALLMIGHENDLHELNKANEEKLRKIGSEFRIARDGCLNEKRAKARELRKAYEGKLKPMLKEEEELIKILGPSEGNNFAKTRAER